MIRSPSTSTKRRLSSAAATSDQATSTTVPSRCITTLYSSSALLAKPSALDPKSQVQAYQNDRPGWRQSEKKEIGNHESNGSWKYLDRSKLPVGRRLVKLVWVYKVKRDGTLKARLCVQGCRQVAGVDYDQTWCGAMRGTSLRLLTELAARSHMRMRRWDFVAAYLQGELLENLASRSPLSV